MNILYLGSHAILEFDQLRMWSAIGHDVFSIGAYSDPANPAVDARPRLYEVAKHPELIRYVEERRADRGDPGPLIDWAKADLHPALLDWADIVVVDCFPIPWIKMQWPRLRSKRVIWRTIGQSAPDTEIAMRPLHDDGLEIVRYSPAERRCFEPMGLYAGEDAVIRFGKRADEWDGWIGDQAVVGNVTQDMALRGEFTGYRFWRRATEGLTVKPSGRGSENLPDGTGTLSYDELRVYLRRIRAYLYTGTQPASYTLGLIEAMMTGCPVVSIGSGEMWLPELFEGAEIVGRSGDAATVRAILAEWLADAPAEVGAAMRRRAIELFDERAIADQWAVYLGSITNARLRERLGAA